jgi:hypothetical protein
MRIVLLSMAIAFLSCAAYAQQQEAGTEAYRQLLNKHQRISTDADIRAKAEAMLKHRTERTLPRGTGWLDYPVSDGLFIESEIHAAVNPTDPDNFIVSPIRSVIVQGQLGGLSCPLYSTTDGGASWSESAFLTEPTEQDGILVGGGDPVLAFDAEGTAHFTWLNFYINADFSALISELCWITSTDGGWTWTQTENTRITSANMHPQDQTGRVVDKQWVAVDRSNSPYRGNMYVAFLRSAAHGLFINVLRKDADKDKFEKEEITVSPDTAAFVQFASIDVDDMGGVHVTCFGSFDEIDYFIWHARSADGGRTFSPPAVVSPVIVPKFSRADQFGEIRGITQDRLYPCPHVATGRGPHASEVYVTWTGKGVHEVQGNGTDIYLARSTDYGATWTEPRIVNDDAPGVERDQFYSSIAVNAAGTIAMTWYDRREDESNEHARYYVAVSRDGGLRFTPNEAVASVPMNMLMTTNAWLNFGIGEYTQVLITDDEVIPFWTDGRKNNGDLIVYSANIDLQTLDVQRHAPLNADFRIEDAWPQPARDGLQLRCRVPRAMDVRLQLTDLLGRVVREAALRADGPGPLQHRFDTGELPAGSYRLVMHTPDGSASRMLRLL